MHDCVMQVLCNQLLCHFVLCTFWCLATIVTYSKYIFLLLIKQLSLLILQFSKYSIGKNELSLFLISCFYFMMSFI